MKILLTGSSGFIGKEILKELKNNHQVTEYDILNGYDILDLDKLESCVVENNIDMIFHVAAEANLYQMENILGAKKGIDINLIGTSNICLICSKFKLKMIYASTMCVYGDTDFLKNESSCVPNPQELYAYTKLAGEQIVKGCSKNFNMDYIILRFATVYGPSMRSTLGCSIFIKQALENKDVTVHGDGSQIRTLTYIDDIVSGCVSAVENFDKGKGKIFNLTNTEKITAKKMAEDVIKITNSKSKIVHIQQRKNQTFSETSCNEQAKKYLNWSPKYSWEEGLKKTIQYITNEK